MTEERTDNNDHEEQFLWLRETYHKHKIIEVKFFIGLLPHYHNHLEKKLTSQSLTVRVARQSSSLYS